MIGVLRARLTCDVKAVLWLSKSNRSPYRTLTRVTIHRPSHTHSSRGLALSSQPAHTHTPIMTIFHFILSHDHIFSRGVPNKTLFARASRASTSRTGRRHALYVLLSLQRVAVRADVVDHRRDEREVARVARREGRHVLAGVRLDRQRVEAERVPPDDRLA